MLTRFGHVGAPPPTNATCGDVLILALIIVLAVAVYKALGAAGR